MGRCCGGKNAGKPISKSRWLLGRAVFLGYHLVVQSMILAASPFSGAVRNLGKFHRQYMRELWRQIRDLDGIKLHGDHFHESPPVTPALKPQPSAPATSAALAHELRAPSGPSLGAALP